MLTTFSSKAWATAGAVAASAALIAGCADGSAEVLPVNRSSLQPEWIDSEVGCPDHLWPQRSELSSAGSRTASDIPIMFKNVFLLGMTGDSAKRNVTVLVRGGVIEAVGRDLPLPAGAMVIDGSGRWLMPGLVDTHMHLTNLRDIDESLLAVALANGVTSGVEMGGMGLPNDVQRLRLREAVAAGEVAGPTLYLAGPKVVDGEMTREGGAALVDDYRAAGYDLIKVYNQLSREGYRGIMVRAEATGLPVVGHVVRSVGVEGTLGSGQRGIAHMEEYLYDFLGFRISEVESDPTAALRPEVIPYLAEQTSRSPVWVSPTLVFFERMIEQAEDLDQVLNHPRSQYIPRPLWVGNWVREKNQRVRTFNKPEHLRNLRAALRYQQQMTKAFSDAGVPLLVGTDAPATGAVPGFDVHEELANLVEAGVTPAKALAAATCSAAQYLQKNNFGRVRAGDRADLVLLGANPLADIHNTRRIEGVMARGRWFDRPALDEILRKHRRQQ